MTSADYKNELLRQTREAAKAARFFGDFFTLDYIASCVPAEAVKGLRMSVFTGCGDSYCSAIAARPTLENVANDKSTGMNPGIPTYALRCIEFSRYYDTYRNFWLTGEGMSVPMVCAVSISGRVRRVVESLARANKYGCVTVAFTANPESDLAKEAKYVVGLKMPDCGRGPNVTSYQCSMFALIAFSLYVSVVNNKISHEAAEKQLKALADYGTAYDDKVMDAIEKQMFDITRSWLDAGVDNMDFIGDGPDYSTAFFGSAKMVESFGGLTTNDDSEGWCHINYFIRTPKNVGTFFVANERCPSFGRICETIAVAAKLGRPTVVITDSQTHEFAPGAQVVRLPAPQYSWANPLMQHLPMDFVAGFVGAIKNIPDFRTDSELHLLDANAERFAQSKIEII